MPHVLSYRGLRFDSTDVSVESTHKRQQTSKGTRRISREEQYNAGGMKDERRIMEKEVSNVAGVERQSREEL